MSDSEFDTHKEVSLMQDVIFELEQTVSELHGELENLQGVN